MTSKRFTKNQTVYVAFPTFASFDKHGEIKLGLVVSRVVEGCGLKQITFFDRCGDDDVYGRSCNANDRNVCNTPEEAFMMLRKYPLVKWVSPTVYSDDNKDCFEDYRNNTMRFDSN